MDNKHLIINDKKKCTGCSSCFAICPKQAINMIQDNEGFLYPKVDSEICVNCGLCERACPNINYGQPDESIEYYAVKNKNEKARMQSSSGGVFSMLAEYVIAKGGVIYGAAFDDEFGICHRRVTDEKWKLFRGSKYVQSKIGDSFLRVKEDLLAGKMVLFSGTPCQIDGLLQYLDVLKISQEQLITVDLVCHGVPSPLVWKDFLTYSAPNINKSYQVSFRNKNEYGWHNSRLTIMDSSGKVLVADTQCEGKYFLMFFSHYILRPACEECKYSNYNRVADFTLGDFWGIEKVHPELDDDRGISLLMLGTEKAKNIWDLIKEHTEYISVSKGDCRQPNLVSPSRANAYRELFWKVYNKKGFAFTAKMFGITSVQGLEKYKFTILRKGSKWLFRHFNTKQNK